MRLNYVDIRGVGDRYPTQSEWLCKNVAFLYSEALARRKVSTKALHRVNVRFGKTERPWDGDTFDGVAEVFVRFDPSRVKRSQPQVAQEYVLSVLECGLTKLTGANAIPRSVIVSVHKELIDRAFKGEYIFRTVLKVNVPSVFRGSVRLVMHTRMDHLVLAARLRVDGLPRDVPLLESWPSPHSIFLELRDYGVQRDKTIFLRFRDFSSIAATQPTKRFGRERLDFRRCLVKPAVTRTAESVIVRYSCAELIDAARGEKKASLEL